MQENKKNFSATPNYKRVEKPWGYEIIFTPKEALAVGKVLHINTGCRFSLQYHDKKQETLFLLKGRANLIIEDKNGQMQTFEMEPQKGYFIAPFQKHRCQSIKDCDILEASTKEEGTTVRLEDDYNRKDETEEMRKLEREKLPNEEK